ncbi:radical SAM family heme chaperone HemW, partial [Candidatus Peregrinibacteria bacterium]|nr:radical SAM family heme chaperone HemW [Candidatus Peregrinibacteria bacterium]
MNIYIHIPFCSRICSYCTFAKVASDNSEIHQKYFEALKKEIVSRLKLHKYKNIQTIYFGGGTPSLIPQDILGDFFTFLKDQFQISNETEITLECHPATVTAEKAKFWEEIGVTRLSLGVQSFLQKFDVFLERDLSYTIRALEILQRRKYDLSIDLIFGFPEQTQGDLEEDLTMISQFNVDHISYYALDYKVHSKIEQEKDRRLSFSLIQKYYQILCSYLKIKGFDNYELYNFGKKSLHNLGFWEQKDYIGFGLSAVSCVNKSIRKNTHNLSEYLNGNWMEDEYLLSSEEYFEQYLKRGLRLTQGVSIQDLENHFGKKQVDKIVQKAHTAQSWMDCSVGKLSLKEEGKMNFFESIE